jgi:hypothetical protein
LKITSIVISFVAILGLLLMKKLGGNSRFRDDIRPRFNGREGNYRAGIPSYKRVNFGSYVPFRLFRNIRIFGFRLEIFRLTKRGREKA